VSPSEDEVSKNLKISLGLVVAALVAVAAAAFASGGDDGTDVDAGESDLVADDSLILSEGDSDVTFVEFLDFECEACGAAFPAVEQLRAAYGDDVTFVVRHFPLHGNSVEAARAVEAAAAQGRLEDMYIRLFETQTEWGHQNSSQEDVFFGYADDLGLDMDRFREVYDDPATLEKIMRDQEAGRALGVTGTPTFFFNGEQLDIRSFGQLPDMIEQAIGD
jgi:protein-disulfide isomerase